MIRGSAFSVILHGGLLALLLFGLPHIMLLVEDEPLPEPARIEVATVTPEEADALEKAAAQSSRSEISGERPGLVADAANTETREDRRTRLQSAAATSTLTQDPDGKIDAQAPPPDEARKTSEQQTATEERAEIKPDPAQSITQERQIADQRAAQIERAKSEQAPAEALTPSTAAALAPERQNSIAQEAAQSRTETEAATALSPANDSAAASARQESAAQTTQVPIVNTATSGAVALAQGDSTAQAVQPLVAALPRLDQTVGEILAAQTRSPAEAVAAAQGAPALQQSILRMASAAEQGYAHAQFSLAEIFLTGNGQPRDVEKGRQYLERASLNGYLPAQLLSAALAAEGNVLPRDAAEAHAWLSAAAEQGSKPASEALRRLEQDMSLRDNVRARQRRSQLRQVFVLSNPKPDTQIKQPPREDPLRVATTLGDVEAVYVLLAQGSDANKPDSDGRTAAIEAAWRGYSKILNGLLDQGANVQTTDSSGKTALIWAAINGHTETAERLISADSAINAQDSDGMTALMRAAWDGHGEVVKLLLQKRANPNLKDRSGKTALDYATQGRQAETARLLQAASRG